MRQQGEDKISVKFRIALNGLCNSAVSKESWELLCTQVVNQLPSEEVAAFDTALRLYFTNEEVQDRNTAALAGQNMPVKKITAQHKGRNTSKATSEEADNLYSEIDICIGARVMLTSNL